MIEAVIFDMDGLMFDTERLSKKTWQKCGEKYGYIFDDEIFDKVIGVSSKDAEKIFREAYGENLPYREIREEKNKMMINEIKENGIRIKKGLHECIKYLKDKHILIAVASSSDESTINFYLKLAKLSNVFDYIISGESLLNSKPDPEIFIKCCKKLNVNKENVLILEDSANGIKAANNANIKVVYVPDLAKIPEDVEKMVYRKVKDLLCVPKLIEEINMKNSH